MSAWEIAAMSEAAQSARAAASRSEEAARRAEAAADRMEEAARRIEMLLDHGYGGPGARLIELLEAASTSRETPQ